LETAAFADDLKGGVGGDAHQPGAETGFPAKPVEVLDYAEERLLDDVFSILTLSQYPEGKGIDLFLVAGGEGFERVEVAPLGPLHQFNVRWSRERWSRNAV
jgi:hypothetical protein